MINNSNSRNKRIAKNTGFLYIRMLLIMTIQFFTVRITLKYLGVTDFGIYNVVCGVTHVFTFLTHTMTSASQRFLAYDLGIGDLSKLRTTFNTLTSIFTLFAIIGTAIIGIIGYWIISSYLTIPTDRLDAALFAFVFTLLTLLTSIIVLPFNSLIIAHEDMKTFAYVSVFDAVLKLLIVYILVMVSIDKLRLYSVLTFIAYLIPSALYIIYCCKKYEEVSFEFSIDNKIAKKLVPFMSWNLLGGLSWMLCTQGLSIVINLFFGPVANAAKGISDKVNSSINGFANNFMMAVQPQIVKTYASKDMKAMHNVIFMSSRMSFYLMLLLTIPIATNADGILSLWLEEHDILTTRMLQCVMLFSLIGALENPINQAIRATGEIRNYQVYIGIITLLSLPFAYFLFKINMPAYYGYIALVIVYGIAFICRLYYLKKQIGILYSVYIGNVLMRCFPCFIISVVCQIIIVYYFSELHVFQIVTFIFCFIISICAIFFIGVTKSERNMGLEYIKSFRVKKHRHQQ